jgi:hypothetical protein
MHDMPRAAQIEMEQDIERAEREIMGLLDETPTDELTPHIMALFFAVCRYMIADGYTLEQLALLIDTFCPTSNVSEH